MVLNSIFKCSLLFIVLGISFNIYAEDISTKERNSVVREDFYSIYSDEDYLNNHIEIQFFELFDFINNSYTKAVKCPDGEYKKHKDYLLFLSRLMAFHHLFNNIRDNEQVAKNFGTNTCSYNWTDVISSCKPQSKEMQFFIKSLSHFKNEFSPKLSVFEKAGKKERKNWIKNLNNKLGNSITHLRLRGLNNISDESSLVNALKKTCAKDLESLKLICSEQDRYFGYSYSASLFNSVLYSGGLSRIPDEYQYGCLRRFVEENSDNEKKNLDFQKVFYASFNSEEVQPIYQYAFLKEIQDKGLKDVFSGVQSKAPVIVEKEEPVTISSSKPKFEKIEIKQATKQKPKVRKKVYIAKPLKPKKPSKSTFYIAAKFRRDNNLSEYKLDMFKFKNDYIFTENQKNKIAFQINKFIRYKALEEMKKKDRLGTNKAPFPLTFIKFLVDENMHQGLFNIINVIGEEFYVLNNIDRNIKQTELIKLENNQQTQNKWQISILEN